MMPDVGALADDRVTVFRHAHLYESPGRSSAEPVIRHRAPRARDRGRRLLKAYIHSGKSAAGRKRGHRAGRKADLDVPSRQPSQFTSRRMPMPEPRNDRRIDYIEFPVPDVATAKQFYGTVFGWTFTDYGPDYTSFEDGRLSGAFAGRGRAGGRSSRGHLRRQSRGHRRRSPGGRRPDHPTDVRLSRGPPVSFRRPERARAGRLVGSVALGHAARGRSGGLVGAGRMGRRRDLRAQWDLVHAIVRAQGDGATGSRPCPAPRAGCRS